MLSDLDIAQQAKLRPIEEIAASAGITHQELEPYGTYKAKVRLSLLERTKEQSLGKYIVVTAITPTPLGEGKTTTSVGLAQGLGRLGKRAFLCLRQPSMGPLFGIKGGAAGGGHSQVVPMQEFNLHLTGDTHAVGLAHNLIAAAIDARIMHEEGRTNAELEALGLKRLDLDPYSITWRRVVDVNDRALRNVVVGLGEKTDGRPRQTGFDITVASELMAILALASDYADMRRRVGRIVLGTDRAGKPITAEDLGVAGAATALLVEAIKPNLMQTLEGQPVFVHAGPFANIAHGNSSILADQMALRLGEYCVTESGFAADMGMEKFMNIKCRVSGLRPNCVVLVATIRALKMHGGGPAVVPGRPMAPQYQQEDIALLEAGCQNLTACVSIARRFKVPVVVALNHYPTDTEAEQQTVLRAAHSAGAFAAVVSTHFGQGGAGAIHLAEAVTAACENSNSSFEFLYSDQQSIRDKIHAIATGIYGAAGVEYDMLASRQIDQYSGWGFGNLPICMAKTHLSLSHDPTLKGVPRGYVLPIREIRLSAGAGFLYPLCGQMRTMPGLPTKPGFLQVDIDEQGNIRGLF